MFGKLLSLMASLQSLDGATVSSTNGDEPFVAVDASAESTGAWELIRMLPIFGKLELNFAQQSLPLNDLVSLEVQCVNKAKTDTNYLPVLSKSRTLVARCCETGGGISSLAMEFSLTDNTIGNATAIEERTQDSVLNFDDSQTEL
ncbi:hypothetical protein D9758_001423 [Tetrapyrgos nigripes]|uniref:Uncharacterized protein n=1 Tax=Tetrapyrgos nigripes TaxID=182062 RepID=A0A8H5GRX0_9AGAR|nr:hypothetical protein D9758_001423 [Tetrapyrgos nigripes]